MLADQYLSANTLFWITVWITALVQGPMSKHIGPWSADLEPRDVDRVPRFKLRGSRHVDAEPGLLGLVAGL